MHRLLLSFLLLLSSIILHAGGFQLNAQGQRQMGMGHCGTGLMTDNASLFFNPGITPFLEHKFEITAGTNLIAHRTIYLEPAPGVYTDSMKHDVGTPFELYVNYHVKNFDIGLAVYTPFGSKAAWPDDWKGAALIQEISLKTIFIQPTVSCKVNDRIGIGFGYIYAIGGFELQQQIPVQDSTGAYGKATLDGSASGMGFNTGLFFKINDHFSAGISYRSSVNVEVKDGSAEFKVPSSLADHFPATTFSSNIKLPSVTNFGLGYSGDKWKVALDLNFVGWHTYDTLHIDFKDNTDKLADVHSARMYKDTYIIRGGAEYMIDNSCTVRFGAYYDHTPVQDGYLTPETPDADRIGITCGATVKATKKLSFDFSLLYIEAMKRYDQNLETGFAGTYKTRVIAPGFGFRASI
ncbi:MAG TPA: outer membrane protein transport protein [Bacteroidia bacterium]|jgi:long-chain fatty acid transport protein|nr:outer membrane protein transport protein [Bacteroidia bacterium]